MLMLFAFFRSLRPKQWTKNLLLFAGVFFAQRWNDSQSLQNSALAFAVFCALSGVVYVVNDVLDVEQDRQHPKKCKRPIASGAISPAAALVGAILLAVTSVCLSLYLLPNVFTFLAVLYLILVSAYSLKLKHMVILDILVLAVGFVLRALAGIEAIRYEGAAPVEITSYFLLTTLFLALFLASSKRRSEIVSLGDKAGSHRKVLEFYSREFLDILLTLSIAGTIFSYSLWTTQGKFTRLAEASGQAENTYLLVMTLPFVLYGMFRYLWLVIQKGEGGAPDTLLLEDKPLLITVFLWMITVVGVLWKLN
ncbi:MAG: decaprenyl-phosphate phosphoribosyltransferase [Sumerlaeia bacterium]